MNKAELTAALAMRTKMSKADAGRAIEALFDDKGIIAGELKKGAKVQITGFGNFEARKRAARMGRNPKTGGVIQIKASIAHLGIAAHARRALAWAAIPRRAG